MLYENDTLPVKDYHRIRLEKIAARIARHKSNLRPENRISTVKLKDKLQLRGWVILERVEESPWLSKM